MRAGRTGDGPAERGTDGRSALSTTATSPAPLTWARFSSARNGDEHTGGVRGRRRAAPPGSTARGGKIARRVDYRAGADFEHRAGTRRRSANSPASALAGRCRPRRPSPSPASAGSRHLPGPLLLSSPDPAACLCLVRPPASAGLQLPGPGPGYLPRPVRLPASAQPAGRRPGGDPSVGSRRLLDRRPADRAQAAGACLPG
jgi:hypothetical protein